MALAQFTFASMLHRGFLADAGATTAVQVTVGGKAPIVRQVPMMTPGDVTGIPARQVIRCAPANGIANAEPNYLATIDFDAPDLPWLFSRKPTSGPLLPWIALAVVDLTDLAADPLAPSPVGTQADDRRRAAAQPGRELDVGARPAARHRHRAGRSGALAVASRQLAQARGEPPLPRLRRAGVRRGPQRRPRHRPGRRAHEHGPGVGPGRRRGHAAGLLLVAFRDRAGRRLRISRPPAPRRAAAARARLAAAGA